MEPRAADPNPRPAGPNGPELQALYEKFRQSFSAADLQRYTELDEGVSADEFLAEMEEAQKQADLAHSELHREAWLRVMRGWLSLIGKRPQSDDTEPRKVGMAR